ncbi:MAG: hypothetical protein IJS25_05225, partial [Bacteroidales bacterium]|nr:hypothetical protein [Bacteroidales bacterium]
DCLLLLTVSLWAAPSDTGDSWFRQTLRELIFVDDAPSPRTDSVEMFFQSGNSAMLRIYEGRTIASISVVDADDVLSATDSASREPFYKRWSHTSVNAQHVMNYLLFRVGDALSVFAVTDSERLLRAREYIEDVRIVVRPSMTLPGQVDVTIIVRATIPFAVELRVHKLKSVGLVFSNKNVSGQGLDISAGVYLQRSYKQPVGYTAQIGYDNFRRTFIAPKIFYSDRKNLVTYGLAVTRDFETPEMKYAGHLLINWNQHTITDYYENLLLVEDDDEPFVLHYQNQDFWIARSIALNSSPRAPDARRNVTVGIRSSALNYLRRVEEWGDRFYSLQDQRSVLFSLHYSRQAYVTASRVYNYGRTEDIPKGWSFELTGGRSFDERMTRNYFGGTLSAGGVLRKGGYVYLNTGFGGFVSDDKMTQATAAASVRHFSRLYPLWAGEGRTFLSAHYRRALKTVTDDYLTLNRAGIEGVRSDSIRGKQRLVLQWESDFFTPWRIWGAQSVLFAFADVGWITQQNQSLVAGHTYASVGLGLRMRNERLVFSTVQFRFAYLIRRPEYISFEMFDVSDDRRLRIQGFEAKAPEMILLNN